MADSTNARAGSTAGTSIVCTAAANRTPSPSDAITTGAALWAR